MFVSAFKAKVNVDWLQNGRSLHSFDWLWKRQKLRKSKQQQLRIWCNRPGKRSLFVQTKVVLIMVLRPRRARGTKLRAIQKAKKECRWANAEKFRNIKILQFKIYAYGFKGKVQLNFFSPLKYRWAHLYKKADGQSLKFFIVLDQRKRQPITLISKSTN